VSSAGVAVFGPHPLLTVVVEPGQGTDAIHLHAGGQGVWVARMAAELGAEPILCSFLGGETGRVLAPLLEAMPGERRLVPTAADSGCYVMDRRGPGPPKPVAQAVSGPPSRHELDDLVSATVAASLRTGLLVLCNPYPGNAIPTETYSQLATDLRPHGVRVLADLSTPRLDAALRGGVDLVKINDWELAEFVCGPVEQPQDLAAAAGRIMELGAGMVVITRGERPAVVFRDDERWELTAPRFDHGFREGCGDSMMGAIAAVSARGGDWREALTVGAAAGAVNFLRRGLGTGDAGAIAELAASVTLEPYAPTA